MIPARRPQDVGGAPADRRSRCRRIPATAPRQEQPVHFWIITWSRFGHDSATWSRSKCGFFHVLEIMKVTIWSRLVTIRFSSSGHTWLKLGWLQSGLLGSGVAGLGEKPAATSARAMCQAPPSSGGLRAHPASGRRKGQALRGRAACL